MKKHMIKPVINQQNLVRNAPCEKDLFARLGREMRKSRVITCKRILYEVHRHKNILLTTAPFLVHRRQKKRGRPSKLF